MTKCYGCGKFISPSSKSAATCSLCSLLYHKGCVSLPELAPVSKEWVCPECKKMTRKGDNSSTPVRSVCEDDAQNRASGYVAGVPDAGICQFRSELAECVAEIREFRKELAGLCVSIAGITERMDSFEKRLETVENRKELPGVEEVAELERKVNQLKLKLNDRDQEALSSDLEIGHLPEEKGESVVHSITVLASRMGVRLDEKDVVFAERVGATPGEGNVGESVRPRRVVVRLARRHLRDELLQAARVRRTLTVEDVGRPTKIAGSSRIFLNERLTRTNRQLFHRVREECRRLQWRFSWTKRGRIYARQSDGKTAYHIRSEADLPRVFEANPV